MKFSYVGFDVKTWPWNGNFNADDTGWDINEKRRFEVMERYSLNFNEYSFIEIRNQELLDTVCEWVTERDDRNLIAVQFPQGAVSVVDDPMVTVHRP